jgi:outer membrane murein-binding lipoprotein Lpp
MDSALQYDTITEENKKEMKKPLNWTDLILGIVIILLSFWGIVYNYSKDNIANATRVENHETRIKQLESDRAETKEDIKAIRQSQEQALILLQNKQDRK